MKTLFFALFAIIALSSCTKDEPLTVEQEQTKQDSSVLVESWGEGETQTGVVEF